MEDHSWRAVRRFMVTTDALNLRGGFFSFGDVVTEDSLAGKAEWLMGRGAIQETDYDIGKLFERPLEKP